MPSRKPLIVYVSGAPGAGKTTLADQIAKEFYIPHISSDLLHGGVRFTAGKPHDRKAALHDVFVPTLVDLARRNVSFVVDHVLQRDMSEKDIVDKIAPYACVVYIHVHAVDSIRRHLARELKRADKGIVLTKDEMIARSEYHKNNLQNTIQPLDVNLSILQVDTSNGYQPSLEAIITFIEQEYEKGTHAESN